MSNLSHIQKLMKYLRTVQGCVPDLGIRQDFLDDDNHQVREVKQAVVALCIHLCPTNLSEKVIFQRDETCEFLGDEFTFAREEYQTFFPQAKSLVGSAELMNVRLYTNDKKFTPADKKEFVVRGVMICTEQWLDFNFFKPFTRESRILLAEGKITNEKQVKEAKKPIESEGQRREKEKEYFRRDAKVAKDKYWKELDGVLLKYRKDELIKGRKSDLMLKREQNVLLKQEKDKKRRLDTLVNEWTPLIYMTFYILFIVGIVILVFHAYISIFEAIYMHGDMIGMFHYFANGGEIIALAALFAFTLLLFGFTY